MDIRCITTWEDLVAARSDWNALAGGEPLLRWDWLATWWKHYGEGDPRGRLWVLGVYESGEDTAGENAAAPSGKPRLVGVAPWWIRRSKAQGHSIEFLGEEGVCTDHRTILADQSCRDEVAQTIAAFLAQESGHWDLLNLFGVDDGDPMVTRIVEELEQHGIGGGRRLPAFQCWKIELPESWDDYFRTLSKSHRTQMRRALRRVDAAGGYTVRFVQQPDELDAAWQTLVDLHQRRWTSQGEPGCFASPRFDAFHREVVPVLFASGTLRLSVVEMDGKPVAAEYNLAGRDATHCYQSGLDPEQIALEPGRLAMIASIQNSIVEGRRWHDFLRGDEQYKAHWRANPTPAWHFRVANHRTTARLRDAGWLVATNAKGWVKAGIERVKQLTAATAGESQ